MSIPRGADRCSDAGPLQAGSNKVTDDARDGARKGDQGQPEGRSATTDMLEAMGKYNEALVSAGVMLGGDGLKPSSQGKRIAFDGPGRRVIDGPFAETKELVAGFWLWEVKDMDEAVAWVKRCPNPMPGTERESNSDRCTRWPISPKTRRPRSANSMTANARPIEKLRPYRPRRACARTATARQKGAPWRPVETHRAIEAVFRIRAKGEAQQPASPASRASVDLGRRAERRTPSSSPSPNGPRTSVPANPGAWLMTVAKRRAIVRSPSRQDARAQARGDRHGSLDGEVDGATGDIGRRWTTILATNCWVSSSRPATLSFRRTPARR